MFEETLTVLPFLVRLLTGKLLVYYFSIIIFYGNNVEITSCLIFLNKGKFEKKIWKWKWNRYIHVCIITYISFFTKSWFLFCAEVAGGKRCQKDPSCNATDFVSFATTCTLLNSKIFMLYSVIFVSFKNWVSTIHLSQAI